MNERTIFLFGLAGVGKSFLANYISKKYAYFAYEGDEDITEDMKQAIKNNSHFTNEILDDFFKIVSEKIVKLQKEHSHIVVSQGLYRNRHRQYLKKQIPELELVWLKADEGTLLERLKSRMGLEVSADYADKIKKNFELPTLDVLEIENNGNFLDIENKLSLINKL